MVSIKPKYSINTCEVLNKKVENRGRAEGKIESENKMFLLMKLLFGHNRIDCRGTVRSTVMT